MDDDRLAFLLGYLQNAGDGFANNCVLKPELFSVLEELRKYREKPLHCPGCDGDHL